MVKFVNRAQKEDNELNFFMAYDKCVSSDQIYHKYLFSY